MTRTMTPGDAAVAPPPRRSRAALILPIAVAAATAALIGWTAWPTLRPVRTVEVTQAVFDRSATLTAQASVDAESGAVRAEEEAPGGRVAIQAPGWLEAEPFFVAATALADGIVESIDVLEGDRVEAGQVVARMVAEDSELRLAAAEAALATAEAGRGSARAELAAAQTAWDEPVGLERAVEAGAAAVAEADAELAQLPSLIAGARATLVQREQELARAEESRTSGAATELEVIVARQRAEAQTAEVAALVARGPMLEARGDRLRAELRAARRDLELRIEDRRRLDAARAAAADAEAEVQRARVARDEAALELDRMIVRAPISGYVQRRLKVPGDKVVRMMDSPHSLHLVHLYDPSRIQVRVDVPLADAAQVYVGQRCEVVVEVLPDRVFAGEVLRTTHEADLQKNTLQVKVAVLDPSPLLRPEMLTRVKFLPRERGGRAAGGGDGAPRGERHARVLVPIATLDDAGRVWLVTERRGARGRLTPVAVEMVSVADGWATVSGPIAPGALVALATPGLRAGEIVRVRDTLGVPDAALARADAGGSP